MVEGCGGTDFRQIKTLLYQRPDLLHHILDINAQAVTAYLNAQIEAGAQAIMIFDTWGGALSHSAYLEFSLNYMTQIIAGLKREQDGVRIPNIIFTKGGGLWLEKMVDSQCDAIGLDWTIDIGEARRRVHDSVALQGNLDPGVLFATTDTITAEVEKVLASYGRGTGHVFNLGHGISQFTPPENALTLVEAVHTLSRKYHMD
jgi:uroporphyrinogen decarboxylase